MIRRPPRSTRVRSSAASDVYKRQGCGQRDIHSRLAGGGHPARMGDMDHRIQHPRALSLIDPERQVFTQRVNPLVLAWMTPLGHKLSFLRVSDWHGFARRDRTRADVEAIAERLNVGPR